MKWVTWRGVHVDRMACAWLIVTHIDPEAEFLFVPPDQAELPEGAIPFDIPGARFSHHQGHASFHALVRGHDMGDPVLRRLAQIVDEADVSQELSLEPFAPGLAAICTGIRVLGKDDDDRLERSGHVFDALYAALQRGEETL